jgi:hypothetical protein
MARMLATEAVVIIVVANAMARMSIAEPARFDQFAAKAVMPVPATETTPMNVLERSAALPAVDQRCDCARWGGPQDGRHARGRRGEDQGTE